MALSQDTNPKIKNISPRILMETNLDQSKAFVIVDGEEAPAILINSVYIHPEFVLCRAL